MQNEFYTQALCYVAFDVYAYVYKISDTGNW